MKSPDLLTIIVPVFNEAESLPRLKSEMDRFLSESTIPATPTF